MLRVCNLCNDKLPEEDFNFKIKKKNIRQSYCRSCHKAYLKKHYKENTEYYKEKAKVHNKRYQAKARKAIYEFKLSNPCEHCGIEDPRVLEFNHTDPSTKKYNVAEMVKSGHSVNSILDEIAKCVVLCANCHRIETAKDFEYYSHTETINGGK